MNFGKCNGKDKRHKIGHKAEDCIENNVLCQTCGGNYVNLNDTIKMNFAGIDLQCTKCCEGLQVKSKEIHGNNYPIRKGHWNDMEIPASKNTLVETIDIHNKKIRFCYLFYRKIGGYCIVDSIAITECLGYKNISPKKTSIICKKATWIDM